MVLPDRWLLLKISRPDHKTFYRIWATWSGSYLYGGSWRCNSGITDVKPVDDGWEVSGASGTLYHLRRSAEGIAGMLYPPVEGDTATVVADGVALLDNWKEEYSCA